MKIIHSADWHAGFRQFDKLAPSGINQREVDVAETLARTVTAMIEERPNAILIAGDVFHHSHPSNPAIVHTFNQVARMRKALPACEIIMVAGNHDAPRTADAGCILQLFRSLGVHVVERAAETLEFPSLDLEVLAVPDVVGIERPVLRPSTTRAHRVLLLHGEIAGMMRVKTAHEFDASLLNADQWSYVALGHYHVMREVAPRAYYSGSIDYTSTNPWGEIAEERERLVPGKGFIVQDLATNAHRFVSAPPSRAFCDLGTIDTADLTPPEIDAAIAAAVGGSHVPIDGTVARLVLTNTPRHRLRELNPDAIRGYRARALQFQIDTRKPEEPAILSLDPDMPRRSLEQMLTQALRERTLPAEIDRPQFVASGMTFLRTATDAIRTPAALEVAA